MIHVCVIWDLDNCLSDDEQRIKLIDWSKYPSDTCWDDYHAACAMDNPGNTQEFFRWHNAGQLSQGRGCTPVFITARPGRHREVTRQWLKMHLGCSGNEPLFMRAEGDDRRSVQIKADVLRKFRTSWPNAAIVAAFDDQPAIVEMYRNNGISGAQLLKIHDTESHKPPDGTFSIVGCTADGDGRGVHISHEGVRFVEVDELGPVQGARPGRRDVPSILAEAAATFASRNGEYREAYREFGGVLAAMFPQGLTIPAASTNDFARLALFVMGLGKWHRYATNFAAGGHVDSIHDAVVYAAMLEQLTKEGMEPKR